MMQIIEMLIQIFWLLLPASMANMVPPLVKWIPFLNYPVDFGKTFRGKPILGKNKTYRGFFFGILAAIITVYLQQLFYAQTQSLALLDYSTTNVYLLGFLLGFGALFGDILESFFKRQRDIESGQPWFPFDQVDWVVGAFLFMFLYIQVDWPYVVVGILMFCIIHPLVNLTGYYLGINKNKF